MDYELLGKRIRARRLYCKMTQEELAERTGISCSFVGHIERGEKKFSIGTLVSLCNALGVSPDSLLQDSLSSEVLSHGDSIGERNRALVQDILHVLHEHWDNETYYP